MWPVLASQAPSRLKEIADHLEKIHLGKDPIVPLDSVKAQRISSPARTMLIEAVQFIAECRNITGFHEKLYLPSHENWIADLKIGTEFPHSDLMSQSDNSILKDCHALPELNKATIASWFPLIRRFVMHKTNGHPELTPGLRQMGMSRVSRASEGSKSAEAHIRDGIFKRLRTALNSIVKDSP